MSGEKRRGLLAPSILSADFTRLGDEIALAEAGGADWIHVDVMDGHFVPNLTMGPFIVEACSRVTDLPLDVHLMMEKPERYLRMFADAGASCLSVHVETCPLAQYDSYDKRNGTASWRGTKSEYTDHIID